MRGLKSVGSATIFTRRHALMRNLRRGFYRVIEAVPQRLVFLDLEPACRSCVIRQAIPR